VIYTRTGFLQLPKGRWALLELEVLWQGELVIVQDKDNPHRCVIGHGLIEALSRWIGEYSHLYSAATVKAATKEVEIVDLWEGPNKPIPGPTGL